MNTLKLSGLVSNNLQPNQTLYRKQDTSPPTKFIFPQGKTLTINPSMGS